MILQGTSGASRGTMVRVGNGLPACATGHWCSLCIHDAKHKHPDPNPKTSWVHFATWGHHKIVREESNDFSFDPVYVHRGLLGTFMAEDPAILSVWAGSSHRSIGKLESMSLPAQTGDRTLARGARHRGLRRRDSALLPPHAQTSRPRAPFGAEASSRQPPSSPVVSARPAGFGHPTRSSCRVRREERRSCSTPGTSRPRSFRRRGLFRRMWAEVVP